MKLLSVCLVALSLTVVSVPADAQGRQGRPSAPRTGGGGQAVPRTGPAPAPRGGAGRVAPRGVLPSRSYYSYYYPYRSSLSLGFYGYPYGFYGYGPYPYSYGYYGYNYGYGYPAGMAVGRIAAYGSVRIQGAPRDAQVYADGYYVGVADDFDGTFQHLNLTPGAHRIEIRVPGAPLAFDVRVEPGQTITYHAN